VKQTLDAIYKTHGKGQWKQKLMITTASRIPSFSRCCCGPMIQRAGDVQFEWRLLSDACAAQVGGLGMRRVQILEMALAF